MIHEQANALIREWVPASTVSVGILNSDHRLNDRFNTFAGDFSALSDRIRWEERPVQADLPGFILRENITYSALPLERELSPFLTALENLGQSSGSVTDTPPCSLTLYITPQCPHCPAMVTTLIGMAAGQPNIRLHIIDGSLFPEKALEDRVMAAPCLILNQDAFRWTGAVPESEILAMITRPDPSQLSTATLKQILEEGNADYITQEMIRADRIFEGFTGLLLHETWSVRLGALVVVENLAQDAPALAARLGPILMKAFPGKEISVQGDILYALGEVGDQSVREWIEQTIDPSRHPDLAEAAREASESMESRRKIP